MQLKALEHRYAVCKLSNLSQVSLDDSFFVLAKTDDELSLICHTDYIPDGCEAAEDGFCGFRIAGALDFSLVGILAQLTEVLAQAGISIMAFSTYDTDYILVRESQYQKAVEVLTAAGHQWLE